MAHPEKLYTSIMVHNNEYWLKTMDSQKPIISQLNPLIKMVCLQEHRSKK